MADSTTPPTTPPTGTTPPATPPPAAGWYDSFEPELKGYVETKGFKDPKDLTLAYRNLEKLHGVPADQLLRLPKADDAEGMGKLYDRLGRPAKPEDYGLKGEGAEGEYLSNMAQWAHALGLSAKQVTGLVEKMAEYGKAHDAKSQAEIDRARAEASAALKTKWGAAYEKHASIVDRAAEEFGMEEADLVALRDAMGPAKAMEFLYNIGSKLGESAFVTGDRPAKGALTPEAARGRIQALQQDKAFGQRLINKDPEAIAEWDRLHIWAAGSQAA